MKRMKTAVRRFQRMRIRTQSLICCAIILGMFAAILLVMGLDSSELLVNSGRIVAFRLDEISDNGETLQLTGVDGQSIALSRAEVGSDDYFKIKRSAAPDAYLRVRLRQGEISEIQLDGSSVYSNVEEEQELSTAICLLIAAGFCLLGCLVFVLWALLRRRQKQKNKK